MTTKSTRKRSASKSSSSGKRAAAKKGSSKSKAAAKSMRRTISIPSGASATAPVVYQTLRERVTAVDTNIGSTEKLSDFLKSSGW